MPGPSRLFLISQMGRRYGQPPQPVSDDYGTGIATTPPPRYQQEAAGMRSRLFATLDSIMDGLGVDEELADEIKRRLAAAVASGRGLADVRPYIGQLWKRDPDLAREVGIRFAHHLASRMAPVAKALNPPPGFSPVENSKVGAWHKQVGGKWMYWRPGQGVSHTPPPEGVDTGQGPAQDDPSQQRKPGAPDPSAAQRGGDKDQAGAQGGEPSEEPKKRSVNDLLGGNDPDTFNGMGKMARAELTTDWDVTRTELDQYGPRSPYSIETVSDIRGAAAAHVRDLVAAGVFPPAEVHRVIGLVSDTVSLGKEIGVDPEALGRLVQANIEKLALQEVKAGERTIGDHGIRHIEVNVQQGKKILAALAAGGQKIGAMDKLMLTQVTIDHDLGYTIPAIHDGGFKVSDKFHPQASRLLWARQTDMAKIFGSKNAEKMGEVIEAHSGHDLDWADDPLGSAVRLADNTHLFADKMPDLLYNKAKGAELLTKIALCKGAFGIALGKKGLKAGGKSQDLQEVIGVLRDAMKEHIDGRSDIPPAYRARLIKAAGEISHVSEVFLASRLAGRSPNFTFAKGTMRVNVEHSDARKVIGEVFGDDEQDKQFLKMVVDDFGVPQSEVEGIGTPPPAKSIEVPPKGNRDGRPAATFTWQAGKKSDPTEKALADQLHKLKGEFSSIMKASSPEARKRRLLAWAGEMKKALLMGVDGALSKARKPPGDGWQPVPGGTKGGWRKRQANGRGWRYKYSDRPGKRKKTPKNAGHSGSGRNLLPIGELHPTKPTAVLTMGLPAAGKSHMIGKHFGGHLDAGRIKLLDPDDVKKESPDYDPNHPELTHDWSKAETKKRWEATLKRGESVILDGTGTNAPKMTRKIMEAKEAGYYTKLMFVTVPIDVSLKRNALRPRHVPEDVLREKAGLIWNAHAAIKGKVDDAYQIDNSSEAKELLGKSRTWDEWRAWRVR